MTRIDSMDMVVCPQCNGRGGLHFDNCPADGRPRSSPMSDEDRKIMGSPDAAKNALVEKSRQWRELRQPSMDTAAGHRKTEAAEREVRFQLANAALLWLWHEENPATPSAPDDVVDLTTWKDGRLALCTLAEFVQGLRRYAGWADNEFSVRSDPAAHLGERLDAAAAALERLSAETIELRKQLDDFLDPTLKSMRLKDGKFDMQLGGEMVQRMALAMTEWFRESGAKNYVEMTLHAKTEPFERYQFYVQKQGDGAKTPHELRAAAEARLAEAVAAERERLAVEFDESGHQVWRNEEVADAIRASVEPSSKT